MKEKAIEFDAMSLQFTLNDDAYQMRLAKSQTRVTNLRQIRILTEASEDTYVPAEVKDEDDAFIFSFSVDQNNKKWEDLKQLHWNEKLRLLCNLARLKKQLKTRLTFFLHPDNVVFDDNLMPLIIYRGVRNLVPPFDISEQDFTKQLQCFSIALFSEKFDFNQLYNGALKNANETEFEKQVSEAEGLEQLIGVLNESYQDEQEKADKTMQMISIKRFRLFKRLSVIMIIVAVLLGAPLIYFGLVSLPYQQHLLDAHEEYLATDYDGVIWALEGESAGDLPQASKYILAHSYINKEQLSDDGKSAIMNNVSLKSNENYLLYWIFNGRGEFEKAMEKAKYIDDPQLIMYGLIKQIERAKNNPEISGAERDKKIKDLQNQLDEYREEYNLNVGEEKNNPSTDNSPEADGAQEAEQNSQDAAKNDKTQNANNNANKNVDNPEENKGKK